ncbi:hypothetical protein J4430_02800 [Candidatus Woesearchaeota archaeon]|nr:hypothetical protein [Candidatus Woesearchaeota archaeon]
MPTLLPDMSLQQFQLFIKEVYELPNNRQFELAEMINNIQRFAMRSLKGIRKGDIDRTKKNLLISFGWFMSTLIRLKIDLEDEVWKRFPYVCSYCNSCPCSCKEIKPEHRREVSFDASKRPKNLSGFQRMFNEIYPSSLRSLDHAGVHLAEELGEFSEALWAYRSNRAPETFQEIMMEAADYFSCLVGIFNSLRVNLAFELSNLFRNNCHECHKAPCTCSFATIRAYRS